MKVQTKKEPASFQPVTLTVTFESQEELKAFQTMCEMNVTVPDALSRYLNTKQKETLQDILGEIHNSI